MVNEQTSYVVGKINFVVTSKFKESGHSPEEKLCRLLKRESQASVLAGLEQSGKARYTQSVSTA